MGLHLPALAILFAAAAFGASDGESKALKVQQLYDQAFRYYSVGDYGKASELWEEILRVDPEQKTARQMIKDVKEDIRKKNASRLGNVFAQVKEGRYRSALAGLETLLDDGGRSTVVPALQAELEEIAAIVPEAPMKTKAWRTAVLAVNAAVGMRQDLTLAYNGLRYARELDPGEPRFSRLLDFFLSHHPEFANADTVTPGMTLLKYKHFVALDYLYGSKYHLAVNTIHEILALEPEDLLALKRLGTAYYSMGLPDRARESWKQALKLAPEDAQLKKFLQKVDPKKSKNSAQTAAPL